MIGRCALTVRALCPRCQKRPKAHFQKAILEMLDWIFFAVLMLFGFSVPIHFRTKKIVKNRVKNAPLQTCSWIPWDAQADVFKSF